MQSKITLNNGVEMPILGLGVFLNPAQQTVASVTTAIQAGYRLIDTAAAYLNERQVGEGIRQAEVARDELFITTKLWVGDFGYDSALKAFDASVERLGLDYLDLYLLHWPVPADFAQTIQAWKAAEKLLAEGRVKAIGVSNFTPGHLKTLMAETDIVPAVNQIELNPYFAQPALVDVHKALGIVTQAWSPIGGVYSRNSKAVTGEYDHPLKHPVIVQLAEKYQKTPAQIILRWHLEHGYSVIPKSVHEHRIKENFAVFDFSLTASEVASIDSLDTGIRAGSDPDVFKPGSYNVDVHNQ
ncbi:Aldo/keto reductase [Vibrio xiamenensis]|uniref:Aldo/keto reductase n=1 Tax=Vibrio xiamenensis TaxID=861298 RepID=A0A1G8BY44_9VIBR|nr:aldo/keto reductase [Vibrio xiamenensis]SDH37999.1 Aldo/keto reductase [Vibrio xiamenensis]